MNYDKITVSTFTFTAKVRTASTTAWNITRYVAPRIFGLWLWTVAIVFAGFAYISYQVYESGKIFREQFSAGYEKPVVGLLAPGKELVEVNLPTVFEMFEEEFTMIPGSDITPATVAMEDNFFNEVIPSLHWNTLRRVGKVLNATAKTRTAMVEFLQEQDYETVQKAYLEVSSR